jgi:CRISPR-associated protein Cmr2
LLFDFETPLAYRNFSREIARAAREAVMEVLHEHLPPVKVIGSDARREMDQVGLVGQRITIHPFEIITIGGDDVWLIVPGDAALPVAAAISTAFVEKAPCRPDKDGPCTMSGGVVIADDHNPVRVLRDVAKDLAREAKRARREAEAEMGYIDFHVFKSVDMLDRDVSALRRAYPYTLSYHGNVLRLLARPYAADILSELWGALQTLHREGFPTSQMHQLAEALLRGRSESTLFYEYQRARDHRGYFDHLDEALVIAQRHSTRDPTPWEDLKDERYDYQTALWDIAELYEFVSRVKEQSDGHD